MIKNKLKGFLSIPDVGTCPDGFTKVDIVPSCYKYSDFANWNLNYSAAIEVHGNLDLYCIGDLIRTVKQSLFQPMKNITLSNHLIIISLNFKYEIYSKDLKIFIVSLHRLLKQTRPVFEKQFFTK